MRHFCQIGFAGARTYIARAGRSRPKAGAEKEKKEGKPQQQRIIARGSEYIIQHIKQLVSQAACQRDMWACVHLSQRVPPASSARGALWVFARERERERGRRQLTLFIHVCRRAVAQGAERLLKYLRAERVSPQMCPGGTRSSSSRLQFTTPSEVAARRLISQAHAFILRNELYIVCGCVREQLQLFLCSSFCSSADGTFNQNALQSHADAVLCSAAAFFQVCGEWPGISHGICIYQYILWCCYGGKCLWASLKLLNARFSFYIVLLMWDEFTLVALAGKWKYFGSVNFIIGILGSLPCLCLSTQC